MTPDEHRDAAEQALVDAYGTPDPMPALMRGVIHALLAHTEGEP